MAEVTGSVSQSELDDLFKGIKGKNNSEEESRQTSDTKKDSLFFSSDSTINEAVKNAHFSIQNALKEYIKGGYIRTIAYSLCALDEDLRNELYEELSDEIKAKVQIIVKRQNKSSDPVVHCEDGSLRCVNFNIKECVNKLIFELKRQNNLEETKNVLSLIQKEDPYLYIKLKKNYTTLEDLIFYTDNQIHSVLKDISEEDLGIVYKMSDECIKNKIQSSLSKRQYLNIKLLSESAEVPDKKKYEAAVEKIIHSLVMFKDWNGFYEFKSNGDDFAL